MRRLVLLIARRLKRASSLIGDATARVESFVRTGSAAAWRIGAVGYIFLLEDVYVFTSVFGQFVGVVAAAASVDVFDQVADIAAAALGAGAFVYIFCVEDVFVLGYVFLDLLLAACGWILAIGELVLDFGSRSVQCFVDTAQSLWCVICTLPGAEQKDWGMAIASGWLQQMAAAVIFVTSAAAIRAFLCLLTLRFVLSVLIGILYGVAQLRVGLAATTLEGETGRSPSRVLWTTPLRTVATLWPSFVTTTTAQYTREISWCRRDRCAVNCGAPSLQGVAKWAN